MSEGDILRTYPSGSPSFLDPLRANVIATFLNTALAIADVDVTMRLHERALFLYCLAQCQCFKLGKNCQITRPSVDHVRCVITQYSPQVGHRHLRSMKDKNGDILLLGIEQS